MRRRTFLKGFAATATAASAGPLIVTERTIAQTRTIYVNTWGGSWTAAEEAAFFKPFSEQTGIRVRTVAPVSYAKLKAQVQSGNYEWDITSINQADLLRAEREGLVEPVDWTVVKKEQLFPNAVYANGLAYCALGTNLAYRKDKFPQGGPKSWADFWDVKKFPGNRAMLNNAVRTVQFALVADGVAVDKVFPLDVDRAFRKLDQIKPHIKVWWTQGNQSQQLLRDGEVDMMVMWNARASELQQQGLPVELVWHGATITTTMWGVAKGAPNRKLGLGISPVRRPAEAAGRLRQQPVLRPTNPEAFKHISRRGVTTAPDVSGERQGRDQTRHRGRGGPDRQDPGALHAVAGELSGVALRPRAPRSRRPEGTRPRGSSSHRRAWRSCCSSSCPSATCCC